MTETLWFTGMLQHVEWCPCKGDAQQIFVEWNIMTIILIYKYSGEPHLEQKYSEFQISSSSHLGFQERNK